MIGFIVSILFNLVVEIFCLIPQLFIKLDVIDDDDYFWVRDILIFISFFFQFFVFIFGFKKVNTLLETPFIYYYLQEAVVMR